MPKDDFLPEEQARQNIDAALVGSFPDEASS